MNSKQRSDESKARIVKASVVAADTETTGLDTHDSKVQVTHLSYWKDSGSGAAASIENHDERNKLAAIAADKGTTKLLFNAKFDLRMLSKVGIRMLGKVIDVMLMAQMLLPDEHSKGLKHLARKFLKDPYLEEIRLKQWLKLNKTKIYGHAPKHIIEPYALADAKRTLELFYYLAAGLDKHNQWHVLEREMILMRRVVMPMESYGAMLDLEEVDRLKIAIRKELKTVKTKLVELSGDPKFNPNSQNQVLSALAKEGVFRPTRFSNKTGRPKADVISLVEYPSELGSLVVRYRKISKASTTYLKNFDKKILRVNLNQGGARTGRFSSSGPNLQNIPRPKENSLLGQMRRCFIARPGDRLLFIDYEQIEMRLTAHFSGEEHMLDAINDGVDLHDVTCRVVFGLNKDSPDWELMRYLAKTLNFAVIYGTGAETFRTTVLKNTDGKIRISLSQASRYIGDWKEKHPMVMKMFDDVAIEVAKTGGITNYYGRYMPVDSRKSYVGVNYKVQGTAADFAKKKMLEVSFVLDGKETKLFLVVHDELIFNLVRNETSIVQTLVDTMEDRHTFKVPLTCSASIGKNWYDKKKLKLQVAV